MRKECANEDLPTLISLVLTFSFSTKRKEVFVVVFLKGGGGVHKTAYRGI